MSCEIYIHPEFTRKTELVAALEWRLGMTATIDGHRVRMVGKPKPKGRPMPEFRNALLDVMTGAFGAVGGTREHAARAMRGHDEDGDDE